MIHADAVGSLLAEPGWPESYLQEIASGCRPRLTVFPYADNAGGEVRFVDRHQVDVEMFEHLGPDLTAVAYLGNQFSDDFSLHFERPVDYQQIGVAPAFGDADRVGPLASEVIGYLLDQVAVDPDREVDVASELFEAESIASHAHADIMSSGYDICVLAWLDTAAAEAGIPPTPTAQSVVVL